MATGRQQMRIRFQEIDDLWAGDHRPITLFFCINRELSNGIRKIDYINHTRGFVPTSGYSFFFQNNHFLYHTLKSARSDLTRLREMTTDKAH